MTAIIAGPTRATEIPGFRFSDDVRRHELILVTDEVAVQVEGARLDVRPGQIPTTVQELQLFLEQIRVNEGRQALPVFYPPSLTPP